jgi:hypothetical protein
MLEGAKLLLEVVGSIKFSIILTTESTAAKLEDSDRKKLASVMGSGTNADMCFDYMLSQRKKQFEISYN